MKIVTITTKITITDSDFESSEFKEFVNEIRSGKLQREINDTGSRNRFNFQKVTATVDVKQY